MNNIKNNYAWIVFMACSFMAFTVVGLCSNTRSLFLEPVSSSLSATRSMLSVVLMVSGLLSAGCSMFISAIRKRLTLRQLVIIGCFMLAAANAIYAYAQTLAVFLFGEFCFGLGLGFTSMTVITLIIRAWFKNRHGTLLGCLSMATGLGSVVFAPMVGALIQTCGYRAAYKAMALTMLVTLVITGAITRDSPADKGLEPVLLKETAHGGRAGVVNHAIPAYGYTLGKALHTPRFYLMCLVGCALGAGVTGIQGTYGAYIGSDLGYGNVFAASVVSFLYIFNTAAKVPLGILIDRVGVRAVVSICTICMAGASAALIFAGKNSALAYCFGAFHGVGNIVFTVVAPIVAPAIFGTIDSTPLTGIFMACMSLGSAIGVPAANLVYDSCGSYVPFYKYLIVYFAVLAVLEQFVVRRLSLKKL